MPTSHYKDCSAIASLIFAASQLSSSNSDPSIELSVIFLLFHITSTPADLVKLSIKGKTVEVLAVLSTIEVGGGTEAEEQQLRHLERSKLIKNLCIKCGPFYNTKRRLQIDPHLLRSDGQPLNLYNGYIIV